VGCGPGFRLTTTGSVAVLPAARTEIVVLPEATGRTQPKASTTAIFSSPLEKVAEPVRSSVSLSAVVPLTRIEFGCRGWTRVIVAGCRRNSPVRTGSAAGPGDGGRNNESVAPQTAARNEARKSFMASTWQAGGEAGGNPPGRFRGRSKVSGLSPHRSWKTRKKDHRLLRDLPGALDRGSG